MNSKSKRLGLFVHWDPEDIVDDYVVDYIHGLLTVCDEIIFISNSNLSSHERSKLQSRCHKIILRDNQGLDFGAWQDAIQYVGIEYINQYQELVLANDSCFAPLFPFSEMFEEMESRHCQFWGITQNNTPYAFGQKVEPHLQSYFLVFKQEILRHPGFLKFYTTEDGSNLNFANTVLEKEIKLTSYFNNLGFQHSAYIQDQSLEDIFTGDTQFFHTTMHNRPNYYWDLLLRRRCPVLKRKVFTDVLQMMFVNHYYIQDHGQRFDAIRDFKSLLTKFKSISDGTSIIKHLKRTSTPLQQQLLFDQNLQANCNYLKKLLNQYGHDSLFSFYDGTNPEYDSINKHYTLGRYFFDHQEYQDALLEFQHATQYNAPSSIWYQKGSTELKVERYQQSLESLEKAQQLEPSNNEIKNIVMKLRSMKQQHPHLFQSKQVISDPPFFDSKWYAKNYLEGKNIEDPWTYFKTQGHKEGHQPNPNFHTMFYRENYLKGDFNINPLIHYLDSGRQQGLLTQPLLPLPADIKSISTTNTTMGEFGILIYLDQLEIANHLIPLLKTIERPCTIKILTTQVSITQHIQQQLVGVNHRIQIQTGLQSKLIWMLQTHIDLIELSEFVLWLDLSEERFKSNPLYFLYNLLGNSKIISTIQEKLQKDAHLVFPVLTPQFQETIWKNGSSWFKDEYEPTISLLNTLNIPTKDYDQFEFPEVFCFWLKRDPINSKIFHNLNKKIEGKFNVRESSFCKIISLIYRNQSHTIDISQSFVFEQILSLPISHPDGEIILKSGTFDEKWYLRNHPDSQKSNLHPIQHYLSTGWKLGYQPAPWFSFKNKTQFHNQSAPLVQHIKNNVITKKQAPSNLPLKRICLFAGYDKDGLIDEYVIRYLKELCNYADIHYLADCEMKSGELDKIRPFVKSAQSIRHGTYDFGSYSKLASQIVGWETINQYDELLFVNDSCYCLKSLQEVFDKMNASDCDFWGIQATQGMGMTQKPQALSPDTKQHLKPIPKSKSDVDKLENEVFWDFHVGSYFLAFRSQVFMDEDFKFAVESVEKETNKANIVVKYEMGWTHLLLKKGYQLDCFIPKVYPFHPLFTEWYFELLQEGMPLLKRFLLSENHYYLPDLYLWKDRVAPFTEQMVIEEIENNLNRICPSSKLEYLHHIKN